MLEGEFAFLEGFLKEGKTVVIPEAGLGTGLANLQETAPNVLSFIQDKIKHLEFLYS